MDTIVACATPWGTAAVAVVRVSGPDTAALLKRIAGRLPPPRRASVAKLRDDDGPFDDALVTWMPGPASYTGEDLAELACHGNPLLVERLLAALQAAGARLARAGEFTRRAVQNGRMDLVRGEAVAQAVAATSPEGLRIAREGLDGRLGARLDALREPLLDVAATLEAMLDYPGEDLLFPPDAELRGAIAGVVAEARTLVASYGPGRRAVEGATVLLVGPVNAGKSTLFNSLLGARRAIVSPRPGTTRDLVEATLALPEARIRLVDTAGEREDPEAIEAEGLELARGALAGADLVLFVWPGHVPWIFDAAWARLEALRPPGTPVLRVCTHADLGPPAPAPVTADLAMPSAGVDALRARIAALLRGEGAPRAVIASLRQRDLLATVAALGERSLAEWAGGPAVVAETLHQALGELDALVGRDTREDVLDRLFARFCIGK